MKIRIIVEPEYHNSFWCMETIKGLTTQAYLRKISFHYISEKELGQIKEGNSKDVTVIIGTSTNWIYRIVRLTQSKNLTSLLVANDLPNGLPTRINSIFLDFRNGMQEAISYLGRGSAGRIALFGVNPSSYTDMIKKDPFPWEKDIFYNYGSITSCAEELWEKIELYTAVICVNDIVAVYLLHFLRERGIRIPEDLKLINFSDSFLSKLTSSSITSIEQHDFQILGTQTVNLCAFLSRNPDLLINALIKSSYGMLDSAKDLPLSPGASETLQQTPEVDFYHDEPIIELQCLNQLLGEADSLDIQILSSLLDNKTQEKIAEELNMSLSSLRYRIRKMRSCFSEPNAMLDAIRKYLPANALTLAAEIKKGES